MINCTDELLFGLDESALVESLLLECRLHPQVMEPLLSLVARARSDGFIMKVASGYRSFTRQLMIWNSKARGLRPVFDDTGQAIDMDTLAARDKVFAILRWSALPGASRHHWGTDVDVYGYVTLDSDYAVQLTVAETEGSGPFAEFHRWLDEELRRQSDFFRPYAIDRGGVAPEPWHLSYAPVATHFSRELTQGLLRQQLEQVEFELKAVVLDNLDEIYRRFVHVE